MEGATLLAGLRSAFATPVSLPLGLVVAAAVLVALLLATLVSARARLRTARFQRKSAEVRTGQLVETLAPLLADFPVDPTRPDTATVFLGQPVDYLHFDPETGVTFIEVKSGDSRLSERQRRMRELVEAGAVYWATYRRR
ncbi:MAG TPA: Holliday junction resolvase-like protein [Thermoanaerobaculia bacterium]|nr:Holliday junction resolvase-like protein [Thermoanaerobaculia bacterium]